MGIVFDSFAFYGFCGRVFKQFSGPAFFGNYRAEKGPGSGKNGRRQADNIGGKFVAREFIKNLVVFVS